MSSHEQSTLLKTDSLRLKTQSSGTNYSIAGTRKKSQLQKMKMEKLEIASSFGFSFFL